MGIRPYVKKDGGQSLADWLQDVREYATEADRFGDEFPSLRARLLRLSEWLTDRLTKSPQDPDSQQVAEVACEIGGLVMLVKLEEDGVADAAVKEWRRAAAIPTSEKADADKARRYKKLVSDGAKSMAAKRVIADQDGCTVRSVELALARDQTRMRKG